MENEIKKGNLQADKVSGLLTGSIAWISFEKQLPQHNAQVLVFRPKNTPSLAYQVVRWWVNDEMYTDYTHWARLTPPE